MCGRFAVITPEEELRFPFPVKASSGPGLLPSFNIAPTQMVPVLVDRGGGVEMLPMKWGLIPHWAKDPAIGNKMINARGETITEKPSFRTAFQKRRCLVLASGFYEWKKEGKAKVPLFIHLKDKRPFAMAGLWERWLSPTGGEVLSFTIITVSSNEMMEPIHHRMPVILPEEQWLRWLDPALQDTTELLPKLAQYPADQMTSHAVSTRVNRPMFNDATLVEPVDLFDGE